MSDRHLVPDDERMGIVCDVQHAEVLNVCPIADPDIVHIATDHGMEPDTALVTHDHVTDDDTRFLDKAGGGNRRLDALIGAYHTNTLGERLQE